MVKTILWVEDFANDADLVPDDYDPINEVSPDRTAQIKELFPANLVDTVQVLEDPTQLPRYMKVFGKNYEFILLDINFEVGISQLPEERKAFFDEMLSAGIRMPPLSQPQTIKKLGYYLYWYLLTKCKVETDNIVIFSAYCDEDTISGFREREFQFPVEPLYFDKKESDKMGDYLNRRFSPDKIVDEAILPQAKKLFREWKETGIPEDCILRLIGDFPNWSLEMEKDIISRIESALDKANLDYGNAVYGKILGEATSAFDHGFSRSTYRIENRWYKGVYETLKSLRNLHAHRPTGLSSKEFLLLFSITLRAIFESTTSPVNELKEGEKWLVDDLKKVAKENGVVTRLDEEQINVRIEEKLLQWYLFMCKEAGFIGSGYDLICSQGLKYKFTQETIVHLFCLRALNVMIYCNPMIMSSFKDEKGTNRGPETKISPSINCYFESYSNDRRRHDSTPVPTPMIELAEAYVRSQLEYDTVRGQQIKIFP